MINDITIKNAKPKDKPYKLTDGEGMYLMVHPNGGKYWRLRYKISGKEKTLALGTYPMISLGEARDKRYIAKKQLKDGIDPSEEKKLIKLTRMINTDNSFENVAREWHDKQKDRYTPKHYRIVLKRLETDIFPLLGSRPIGQIKAPELLVTIQKIEKRGAIDLAHRVMQTAGQIFRYAIATGRAERDISADLRGALTVRKKVNHANLKEDDLPEFLQRLNQYHGEPRTKLALQMLILTFVRTAELRGMRWEEINFETKEWHIPAERMKMREKHIVPLSKQVIELLNQIRKLHNNPDFVFPSHINPNKPISENTLIYAIYRMGYHSKATAHGFRATASTILNEKNFRADVIEKQLAHGERNKVRASYNHAQYLPERKEMMQWWADYLDKLRREK
ncbi:MAG: tyrosine-type recombinase/integrase [Pseudomonadota bacterium]